MYSHSLSGRFSLLNYLSGKCRQCQTDLVASLSSPITAENQYDRLADVVTPLWKVPYSEQLELKQSWSISVIKALATKVHRKTKKTTKQKPFTFVPVEVIKESPVVDAYRNKSEFSINVGVDGNPKTVGFFIGKPENGRTTCVRGTRLINLKKTHIHISQVFEEYICSSELPACLNFQDGGHWRNLIVRSTDDGQLMAVVVFHPQDMEPARISEEAEKLQEFFLTGPGRECNLSSLYFQACRNTKCTHQQAPFVLLHGHTHLKERLSGYVFHISPDSFFQINKRAAEVLYNTVLKMAKLTSTTTLLDICCGTGAISILASSHVRGALGVDSVLDAVVDARNNAAINTVSNTNFICGKAEKKISNMMESLELAGDVVAVVNPGRSGLHENTVSTLVQCPQICRLIYISCKADSPNTMSNFVQLIIQGQFKLRKVIPVDLFPHTMHTELVMLFER